MVNITDNLSMKYGPKIRSSSQARAGYNGARASIFCPQRPHNSPREEISFIGQMHFQIVGPSRFDEVLQSDFKSLFTFLRNDFNPNVSSLQETCLGSLIETM